MIPNPGVSSPRIERSTLQSEQISGGGAGACGEPCERFPMFTTSEYKNRPRLRWLIDGFLVEGGVAALYGSPGSFKTFIALDMAASVAAGIGWAGRQTSRRRVLYISAEGAAGLQDRIAAWEQDRGIT